MADRRHGAAHVSGELELERPVARSIVVIGFGRANRIGLQSATEANANPPPLGRVILPGAKGPAECAVGKPLAISRIRTLGCWLALVTAHSHRETLLSRVAFLLGSPCVSAYLRQVSTYVHNRGGRESEKGVEQTPENPAKDVLWSRSARRPPCVF